MNTTTEFQFPTHIKASSLIKRMLTGAAIAFAIISFFVFGVDNPNPDWGTYWMIKPLIVTPIAGAFGILSYYLKDFVRPQSDVMALLVILISTIAFVIALWLGIVLGLNGTMWN